MSQPSDPIARGRASQTTRARGKHPTIHRLLRRRGSSVARVHDRSFYETPSKAASLLPATRTSESNRATGNAFYLSPSPTARNHWESGPSGGRTNQYDSEQAPLGSTAARPAPEPACDATKQLQMRGRRGAALQRSRTATNASRWISRGYSRGSTMRAALSSDRRALAGRLPSSLPRV
jgi:hypothetical protein